MFGLRALSPRKPGYSAFWGQCSNILPLESWLCGPLISSAVYDHFRGFPHHGFKVWFKPLEMYYLCIGDWIIWCVLKFWNKHDLSLTQIIS